LTDYAARLSQATFSGINYFMGMTPRRMSRTAQRIYEAQQKK